MSEEFAMSEEISPRTASSSLSLAKISKKKEAEEKEPAMKKHKFLQSCISQQSRKTAVVTNRVFDLTTTDAKQAILRIQCHVENASREFLLSRDFDSIHTPKFDNRGQPAYLEQSAQFHKQMAICGGFPRVFEVGAYFRAEDSLTHQNLCEFIFLDVEMEIHKHYSEIMDFVDQLCVFIFTRLIEKCKNHLEAVREQYPFEPLKFLPKTLRLTFEEGVQMLKEAGVEVDPLGDLTTESEKLLGNLVRKKYNTEFYILHRYPLAIKPFFTMPCAENPRYSNSFNVYIRGEEIISGAQHIHDPEVLEKRAGECGIVVETISTYINSFRYGTPLHGGFRMVLERVAMLYCALN